MPTQLSGSVLGLMSGTSLDGIDAAILETDGEHISRFGPSFHHNYSSALRSELRHAIQTPSPDAERWADEQITQAHITLVQEILKQYHVDLIGFHGQTILHAPQHGVSKQIGSAAAMAHTLGVDVVGDFRSADIAAGGQGAPLAPLYHLALVKKMRIAQPVAIVNIGGVANITYINEQAGHLLAFDTGPGNGLMDDWIMSHQGLPFDENGKLAAQGQVDEDILFELLQAKYFSSRPPKSLDRHSFSLQSLSGLSAENGMATLLAFTAQAIAAARNFLPADPQSWIICGGGRHNKTLITTLQRLLSSSVVGAEKVGWQGDMIEAQCFAFLATRSVRGLPLSLPSTTGCATPTCGGVFYPKKVGVPTVGVPTR